MNSFVSSYKLRPFSCTPFLFPILKLLVYDTNDEWLTICYRWRNQMSNDWTSFKTYFTLLLALWFNSLFMYPWQYRKYFIYPSLTLLWQVHLRIYMPSSPATLQRLLNIIAAVLSMRDISSTHSSTFYKVQQNMHPTRALRLPLLLVFLGNQMCPHSASTSLFVLHSFACHICIQEKSFCSFPLSSISDAATSEIYLNGSLHSTISQPNHPFPI